MSLPEPNHAAVLVQNHCTSSDEAIVHFDNNKKTRLANIIILISFHNITVPKTSVNKQYIKNYYFCSCTEKGEKVNLIKCK